MRGKENNHHAQVCGEEQFTGWQRHQNLLYSCFAAQSFQHLWDVDYAIDKLMNGIAFHYAEEEPATDGAAEDQSPDNFFNLTTAGNAGDKHCYARGV